MIYTIHVNNCNTNKICIGVNFIKNVKNCLFKKSGKSQNKVAVAEEIGYGNDKHLSKIGQEKWIEQKTLEIVGKSSLTILGYTVS